MKMLIRIIIPLLLCLHSCSSDVSHLKAVKAKLLHKLASHLKEKTHHKRGIFSGVPSYKAGYDIPVVHHSFIKPVFVQYPTKAVPLGVKIPIRNHFGFNYPVPVGHRVPIPYPGYGLKFPSLITKPVVLPPPPPPIHHVKPSTPIHFHPLKPAVPVATAVTPIHPVPTVPFTQVLPAVAPPVHFHPVKPVVPIQHTPVAVQPTVFPIHQFQVHPAPIPVHPAPTPVHPAAVPIHPAPLEPVAQNVPYVIKPGTSVQSSYFATYPKYPFIQTAPTVLHGGIALNNIHQQVPVYAQPTVQIPHYDLLAPEQHIHGASHTLPGGPLVPTPTVQQIRPTLISQDVGGWSPVTAQPTVPSFNTQGDVNHPAPTQAITPDHGYPVHNAQQYSHETPVYENQGDDQGYTFDQNQLQQQYDQRSQDQQYHQQQYGQQQQYDQAQQYLQQQQFDEQQQLQYDQHQYNQQEQQYPHQQQQYEQQQQQYDQQQQQQHYDQQQQQQQYDQQQYDQQQQYGQQQQQYDQQQYHDQQQGYDENAQNIQREGQFDSSQEEGQKNVQEVDESQSSQRYRNHIPLGLQLPLKRPLDEFQQS